MSGFADCALLVEAIRALTLAQAKALIKDINNEPAASCGRLALSGNKPEIINRLTTSLTERKNQGDIRGYQKFRSLIHRYKSPPSAAPAYRNGSTTSAGTCSGLNAAGAYAAHPQRPGGIPANKVPGIASSPYSPLASATANSSRPVGSAGSARINFRPSPFYEIKQFVSPVIQCPEAPTQTDHKNVFLHVTFEPDQARQLANPQHQLRLFCTTMEAHAASLSGRNPATVEFPLTCQARVNGHNLSTNLRGSKKNIGRVPPPNLNKDNMLSIVPGRPNRIELTYANAPKRHVLVAAICEITTVETLVTHLRSKQLRRKEEVLLKMRREAEDDDIEAGAATMSLKCPLSYMRITTPCRSTHCSHVQCFDAESFFSVNEQSPSWACPVCNKTIKVEDLLMDGYVDDILKRVPQDEDSVVVEPDGSWRTSDGRVSSIGTAQATPAAEGTPVQDRFLGRESEEVKPNVGTSSSGAKPDGARRDSPDGIVLLDSPSPPPHSTSRAPAPASASTAVLESTSTQSLVAASASSAAEQQMRNRSTSSLPSHAPLAAPANALAPPRYERIELLSSSTSTSARNSPIVAAGEVIDLTLDSDDEEETVVSARPAAPVNGVQSRMQPGASTSSGYQRINSSSNGSSSASRSAFANYSSNAFTTPNRAGPFQAAMDRVDATAEDEQICRPDKRQRPDIPTPTDPRLINGRPPVRATPVDSRRTSLPTAYVDMGGANGSRSHCGPNGTAAGGGGSSTGWRGGYRDPASARGAVEDEDGDDSWMDNAHSDQDQYLNEDEWWP
ncbi:related to SIZ1 - E3-like factor in the SUMO pathway [Melanopsichium pennsylvanicum]|uniref:Related to SIZ1 - E3-like factor in the SUMO pathway n=1 Tax=Melanopsichium pennsylvanicum TaxID=63383 RepID=A0AAJ4XQK8_9BASI|nr:related to SIZ1 - E3-like factor in the SUMO pathway [Melanopsichium pennsylvanicum]